MIAFWFIESGRPLRFYVLFVGTMSALYALYDIMDGQSALLSSSETQAQPSHVDLILRKVNESDASQFAKLCPIFPAQVWGALWLVVAFCFFATGILAGLAAVCAGVPVKL